MLAAKAPTARAAASCGAAAAHAACAPSSMLARHMRAACARPAPFSCRRQVVAAVVARPGRAAVAAAAATTATADLASQFNIAEAVAVEENEAGLQKVVLTHACGSSAEVFLLGACVTSWRQASGDEVLYVRPDAKFDGSKPISGGIPHCFPQFGPGQLQQHGFARNLPWRVASSSADPQPDDLDPEVTLVLEDSEETRAMWPHSFKAVYSISLHGEQLRTDLRVFNTGDQPFEFTAALHTYIEVADISKARVEGLQGLEYLDKVPDVNNPVRRREEREFVSFEGPVDSVYGDAPERVALEVGTGAAVQIVSKGWKDVVVWNPHEAMADCYRSFACVENAAFSSPVSVPPGGDWRAEQELAVINL